MKKSLEERLRAHPGLYERIARLMEVVENAAGNVNKAAEAERRVIAELRQLGQAALQDWAVRRQQVVEQAAEADWRLSWKEKKRLYWYSCYGSIWVIEQTYRCGRGGKQIRPFVEGAGICCRAYSQPLQRVLTDFGAEESLGRAVERLQEHYGIQVPSGAVRLITQQHAEAMRKQQQALTALPAQGRQAQIIGELDGSMVPLWRSPQLPVGIAAKHEPSVGRKHAWP
jgi:hypothetical protein